MKTNTTIGSHPIRWMCRILKGCLLFDLFGAIFMRLVGTRSYFDGLKEAVEEKESNAAVSRARLWNVLEDIIRQGNLKSFKMGLQQFRWSGLILDDDSGYYEVLAACVHYRPRKEGVKFLQAFFRSYCSRNIMHLLPDLIDDFSMEGLLMLRKYCPVGSRQMEDLLEMLPETQMENPLSRYLLEYWDRPLSLENVHENWNMVSLLQTSTSGMDNLENFVGFADGQHEFLEASHGYFRLAHRNVFLVTEGMRRGDLVEFLPLLLALPNQRHPRNDLERVEERLGSAPGNLALAILADDRLHIIRRGLATFVVIQRSPEDDREELVYPKGSSFHHPSKGLDYFTADARADTILAYGSEDLIKNVHAHDLLGLALYASEDPGELKRVFSGFFDKLTIQGHFMAEIIQLQKNPLTEPRRASRRPAIRPYLIRDETSFEDALGTLEAPSSFGNAVLHRRRKPGDSLRSFPLSSRQSPESTFGWLDSAGVPLSTEPRATQENRHNFFSMNPTGELSYDEDDLTLESSGDETLFERRRWMSLESIYGGYDTSLSRGLFYASEQRSAYE